MRALVSSDLRQALHGIPGSDILDAEKDALDTSISSVNSASVPAQQFEPGRGPREVDDPHLMLKDLHLEPDSDDDDDQLPARPPPKKDDSLPPMPPSLKTKLQRRPGFG